MARKPTVKKGPASYYAGGNETIVEIFSAQLKLGCLLSVRELADGQLCIEPYRGDKGVVVRAGGQDFDLASDRGHG